MDKIKVSAVMYYNTLPMVYGLKNKEVIECTDLSLDIPADCAKKLLSGSVDIGLVPVAVIPQLKNAQLFSNFCIGAKGKVRTVVVLSNRPLEEITHVILDAHSRTSVALFKILAKNYWKKEFIYIEGRPGFEQTDILGFTAGVVIGDKVFNAEKKYPFVIDLAEEWQKYTGLPFVFATWISDKQLPAFYLEQFEKALAYGTQNIPDAVKQTNYKGSLSEAELINYLQNNIDFNFDMQKREALNLFLNKLQELKS